MYQADLLWFDALPNLFWMLCHKHQRYDYNVVFSIHYLVGYYTHQGNKSKNMFHNSGKGENVYNLFQYAPNR